MLVFSGCSLHRELPAIFLVVIFMDDSVFCTFGHRAFRNWVSLSCISQASMTFINVEDTERLFLFSSQLEGRVSWIRDYAAVAARAGMFEKHPPGSCMAPLSSAYFLSKQQGLRLSVTHCHTLILPLGQLLTTFLCNFSTTCQCSIFQLHLCVLDPTSHAENPCFAAQILAPDVSEPWLHGSGRRDPNTR